MQYVAVDLETTGLDPVRDRVIEVGAVAFDGEGRVLDRLSSLADPGRSVPDPVLRLTGIDPQALRSAPPAAQVLDRLAQLMRGRDAIGHGTALEVGFLGAAGLWPSGAEMLDTLDVARILLPAAPSHSLPELAIGLGLEQPRPHRAFDDADAARQLFGYLRATARSLPPALLERLQRLAEPYPWRIARFFGEELGPLPDASPQLSTAPRPRPSRRTDRVAPEDETELAALLGPRGPLAAAIPDFEHREGQVQMLLAVTQAMRRGRTLVVEAGTGTGKSLAYLIPAAARAVARQERVVVATHTHTLQEQLLLKDVPALRAWLPWDFETALMKGRANYLSLRRWDRYLAQPCEEPDELCFKLKILVWLDRTETGDRAELRLFGRDLGFWSRVSSDPLDCVGRHCTPDDCFVHRARAQAEAADLIIVNHALLLANAQVEGDLIPAFEHLIVDEAHHLEAAATEGLRRDVDRSALVGLLDRLASEERSRRPPARRGLLSDLVAAPRLGDSLQDLGEAEQLAIRARARVAAFFSALSDWMRARPATEERFQDSVRLTEAVRGQPDFPELAALAADTTTALAALDTLLRRIVDGSRLLSGAGADQELREIEITRSAIADAAWLLTDAFKEPDENAVYWVQQPARADWPSVRSAPIDVAELLHDQVMGELRSVVLTSASLSLAGDFTYFCARTGVRDAETIVVSSPFDYLRQALLCLPTDVPTPNEERFEILLPAIIADIARRVPGGTLALFTSHEQLRNVHEALHHRSDLDQVRILGQGIDGPRRQVLQAFCASGHSLLLGTASFWEGIDLPGDLLSCVIVVRLPFPVPSEPIYAARSERLRDPFTMLALPQATLRLKQGFGRLIRRQNDRGAVVILDARVVQRDYGRAFLSALPGATRFGGRVGDVGGRVGEWLLDTPQRVSAG